MRFLLLVLSLSAVTWLIVTLLRLPRVPWFVIAYLLVHCLFIGGTWWAWLRVGSGAADVLEYKRTYAAWAGLLILAMAAVAFSYALEWGIGLGLLSIGVCAVFSLAVSQLLMLRFMDVFSMKAPTAALQNHFILASAMLGCGAIVFLSLAMQADGIECSIKLALSLFWLAFGAYQITYALGRVNPYLAPVIRHDWFLPVAAIVACTWLAWTLNTNQRELSREYLSYRKDWPTLVEHTLEG